MKESKQCNGHKEGILVKKHTILHAMLYSVVIVAVIIIGIGLCKEKKEAAVIAPDFHKMAIKELAHHVNIDKEKIVDMLKMNGIRVKDANQPLYTIATNNEMLPTLIYDIITTEESYEIPKSKSSNSRGKASNISGATPYYSPKKKANKSDGID